MQKSVHLFFLKRTGDPIFTTYVGMIVIASMMLYLLVGKVNL